MPAKNTPVILLLILGALPLLAYPIFLLGFLFWLAALGNASDYLTWRMLLAVGANLSALLYPAAYLMAAIRARKSMRESYGNSAVSAACLPILYLLGVGTIWSLWFLADSSAQFHR